jgi:hypothetical protein
MVFRVEFDCLLAELQVVRVGSRSNIYKHNILWWYHLAAVCLQVGRGCWTRQRRNAQLLWKPGLLTAPINCRCLWECVQESRTTSVTCLVPRSSKVVRLDVPLSPGSAIHRSLIQQQTTKLGEQNKIRLVFSLRGTSQILFFFFLFKNMISDYQLNIQFLSETRNLLSN